MSYFRTLEVVASRGILQWVWRLLKHLHLLSQLSQDPSFLGPPGLKIWALAMSLVDSAAPQRSGEAGRTQNIICCDLFLAEETASERGVLWVSFP